MNTTCQGCASQTLKMEMRFDNQVVSHHYRANRDDHLFQQDFFLTQCESCHLIQLTHLFPVAELTPKFNWITCTEPEQHLDELVADLVELPGINSDALVLGLSFKEETTLARFNSKGFNNTDIVNLKSDLRIENPNSMIELVQYQFDQVCAERFINRKGQVDIFIARHILEHAYDLKRFISTAKNIVKDDGYIVFEIPDCKPGLELGDPTIIWEEHSLCFTEKTFKATLVRHGLELIDFKRINYKYENAMIAVVKKSPAVSMNKSFQQNTKVDFASEESGLLKRFENNFSANKKNIKRLLDHWLACGKRVALLGAAHMANSFLNYYGIEDGLTYIIDDNRNMTSLYFPRTNFQIVDSSIITQGEVDIILSTISEHAESKFCNIHASYLAEIDMLSIYAQHKNSIYTKFQQLVCIEP